MSFGTQSAEVSLPAGRSRAETLPADRTARLVFGLQVFLVFITVPYTLVALLRLDPAGSGMTGCLLEEYCHLSPNDVVLGQLPGLLYLVPPLAALPLAPLGHARLRPLLIALLLGASRFLLPVAIWVAGLRLQSPVPIATLEAYCVTEVACLAHPGLSYYFITPIEALAGLTSLTLFVATVTIWLHLAPEVRRE
jgi:hypothetical protein